MYKKPDSDRQGNSLGFLTKTLGNIKKEQGAIQVKNTGLPSLN